MINTTFIMDDVLQVSIEDLFVTSQNQPKCRSSKSSSLFSSKKLIAMIVIFIII